MTMDIQSLMRCKCGSMVYENNRNHFRCNYSINKIDLKDIINNVPDMNKLVYNTIYDIIKPPIIKAGGIICYNNFYRCIWMGDGIEYESEDSFDSWTPPLEYDIIIKLKDFIGTKKALEIGAGTGFHSYFLNKMGCNIIATDSYDEIDDFTYIPVKKLNHKEALIKYQNYVDCLIVIWGRGYPDRDSFGYFKGNKIVVIGEWPGGCTSSGIIDDIIDCYGLISNYWKVKEIIKFITWHGLNDRIFLIERSVM